MTRKITSVAILSLLLVAFLGVTVFAASAPQQTKRTVDKQINASMQYAFPYPDEQSIPGSVRVQPGQQLGIASPTASPGLAVGNTFYDYQHNGRVGRMNETRTGGKTIAHFSWMFLPSAALVDRAAAYTQYDFSTQQLYSPFATLQATGDYAGYVNLDVTNDNRAVVTCHNQEAVDAHYDIEVYWDFMEGFVTFGYRDSVPAALSQYAKQPQVGTDYNEVNWPSMAYVEGPTPGDTVTHVFGQASLPEAGDPQAIYYFRRVGAMDDPAATWDFPPKVVDTVHDIAQTVDGNDAGKTALVWIANVPCTDADPDTASCDEIAGATQWNNDLYYQISLDYGVTWQPRVNVTKSRIAQAADIPHFQPYTDLGILLDTQGDLHIIWGAAYWPTGSTLYVFSRSAILHWSQDVPYIRTVVDATWEPGDCFPGVWNLTVAKMSISECRNKFYVLFSQFNDRPNGVLTDCATESNPGYPDGAANADLYVSISNDSGLTWDRARNLTNSRTPGCDSANGAGGPCDNDMWATMARFGDTHNAGAGVPVVLPAGASGGSGFYLDVQYINDHSAGGIVQDEGTWQNSDVKWFRMQCIDPVVAPNPVWSPPEIGFPAWTKAGVIFDSVVTLTNIGNTAYSFTITPIMDAGPLSGWLSYTGFTSPVNSGLNNTTTGTVIVTPTGAVAGQIYHLTGRLRFVNAQIGNRDYEIDFIVADTVVPPVFDTIATACTPLALMVRSDGLFGGSDENIQWYKGMGLDYYGVDCDTTAGPYIYSGSPVVMWLDGSDTVANWTAFDNDYVTPFGFYPVSHVAAHAAGDSGQVFTSTFLVRDSSIAIEKTWFAPQVADSCNFVVQRLKIYSNDGLAHNDLLIGEAVDWDIPSDTGSRNASDFNSTLKLIWQQGAEYNDTLECQNNDARFGAMKFLGMAYVNGPTTTVLNSTAPFGAYTKDNPTYVYGNTYGFNKSQLWENMKAGGWSKYTSTAPESLYTDLHMAMTFDDDYDLAATGALYIYTAYMTVQNGTLANLTTVANKAQKWAEGHVMIPMGCCKLRGDFNNDGVVKVADLTALINYLFRGGAAPSCLAHGDTNGDGTIKVADLTLLINYLFRGGPAPAAC